MRAVADNLTRRRVLATPLALYIMADDLGYDRRDDSLR
jgi:hypothetical protein